MSAKTQDSHWLKYKAHSVTSIQTVLRPLALCIIIQSLLDLRLN